MAREEFRHALADLRRAVLEMGELVLERLETAISALAEGDDERAETVIDGDAEINRRYLDIEADCIDLFALQQPVAGDLRFVAATFKITTDLERIGDLASNLGRYTLSSRRETLPELDASEIGRVASAMLGDALSAYETEDAAACRAVAERDNEVDTLCQRASERLVRNLLERDPEIDAWTLEPLIDEIASLLLTIRDLERIGDHAVNIAARTLYVLESDPELIY